MIKQINTVYVHQNGYKTINHDLNKNYLAMKYKMKVNHLP